MSQSEDNLTRIFDCCIRLSTAFLKIVYEGGKRLPLRSRYLWMFVCLITVGVYFIVKKDLHLIYFYKLFPWKMVGNALYHLHKMYSHKTHFFVCLGTTFIAGVFLNGLRPYWEWVKYRRGIERLDLKNGEGTAPILRKVKDTEGGRKELTLYCPGIGIEKFEEKKSSLQTSFGSKIERFIDDYQWKSVRIVLTTRELPFVVPFKEVSSQLISDGDFLVGMSDYGLKVQSIKELPHVLVAGSTGGGKSVFLKQMLLGLLRSTPKLQMYLIDLKGGLELVDFDPLSNVKIVKTEKEAVLLLKKINQEMKDRFAFLEKNRLKLINPERDKKDRIVVAIDESSVLYTKSSGDEIKSKLVLEARFLTDEIAKLSRAAGIHLILATQKVSKETVDTKVQENMSGKVCFRMNTIQGSVAILGSKQAHELPQHPGRGIWNLGNEMMEIQAPYLSEKELEEEISTLAKRPSELFQPMMNLNTSQSGKVNFNDFIGQEAHE